MIAYEGLFFDGEVADLIRFLEPIHLPKSIDKLHCTFKYRPSDEELFEDIVGDEIEIVIVGYGCDGNNSGFQVVLPDEVLDYYLNCDKYDPSKITVPHITVSIAPDAKAVWTKNLEFKTLDKPITIKGRFGYCIRLNNGEYVSYSRYIQTKEKVYVKE